jgi:hypothetical protein
MLLGQGQAPLLLSLNKVNSGSHSSVRLDCWTSNQLAAGLIPAEGVLFGLIFCFAFLEVRTLECFGGEKTK